MSNTVTVPYLVLAIYTVYVLHLLNYKLVIEFAFVFIFLDKTFYIFNILI